MLAPDLDQLIALPAPPVLVHPAVVTVGGEDEPAPPPISARRCRRRLRHHRSRVIEPGRRGSVEAGNRRRRLVEREDENRWNVGGLQLQRNLVVRVVDRPYVQRGDCIDALLSQSRNGPSLSLLTNGEAGLGPYGDLAKFPPCSVSERGAVVDGPDRPRLKGRIARSRRHVGAAAAQVWSTDRRTEVHSGRTSRRCRSDD